MSAIALFSSVGVPPNRREGIGGKGQKTLQGYAPRDIRDMGVEAPVLADNKNPGQFRVSFRPCQLGAYFACSALIRDVLRVEAGIVLRNQICPGIAFLQ